MNPGANSTSPFAPGVNATPPPATQPGAASSFGGAGPNGIQTQSAPVTYTIPGTYGSPPVTLTAGQGRLARPLFRFTGTVGFGYDDNVLETPTRAEGVPSRVISEQVVPNSPAHTQQVQVQQANGNLVTETVEVPAGPGTFVPAHTQTQLVQQADGNIVAETVEVPATPTNTVNVVVPGTPAQKRIGSAVTRSNVGTDVQFADRNTVFTLDLNGGADYYWSRPGDKTDYNGTFALAFLHSFTPLLQTTANVNASYITQPNLALIDTPTNNNSGPFLNINARADISYRLMPRISTVLSVSYASTEYTSSSEQQNSFDQIIYGAQLRYLLSPLLTLVGEGRYSPISFPNNPSLAGDSYFLLGGTDWTLSRRFSATIRVGEQIRTFGESGTSASSPFLELSSTYAVTRTTTLQVNAHYGLEEPPDVNTTVEVLRTGLTLTQSLTPRLIANLTSSLVNEVSTDVLDGVASVQNTLEANIGLTYTLSRKWTFSLNYTYDVLFSAGIAEDYYRNRVFLTGNYAF
jgi:Putative beta-barrel porin 2